MRKLKRILWLTLALLLMATAFAAAAPRVGVLYMNNARTTYDGSIDRKLLGNLEKTLTPQFQYILADATTLQEQGMTDLTMAERRDIMDALQDQAFDYILCLAVEPLGRKEKHSVFTQGIEITVTIPFKLINVAEDRYLYNGRIIELQSDSTPIGSVGNKSVTLKALNKVNKKINRVIKEKMAAGR
ncbi:MAG: hypothetical protein IJS96_05470 [Schwartzia sp.]|nr:hypothetical protein [Schwartzia sp. (in: firmicutes)]